MHASDQLQILVESSPNALVLVTADGTIELLNRQAEVLFAYSRHELLGQSVNILVPESFRSRHLSFCAEFFCNLQQRPMGAGRDLFARRKDGSEIPVEIGLTPMEMPEGIRVLATITDISTRKRNEEELRKTAAELARSNEALEKFTFVISHDLQEPLRVISSHLQIVRRRLAQELDKETRESIDFAMDAAIRMQVLIRDILAYARVGRHRGTEPAKTDMETVLSFALRDLAASIQETKALIQYDPLPTVTADKMLMLQVLQNLLSNAIRFRDKSRSPVIEVGAERDQRNWIFRVTDNGIGIDQEKTEQVFRMFERLHNSSEYPGTGIGLAICKQIVEAHGGRIWVDSCPGQGSTFFFTIPDSTSG